MSWFKIHDGYAPEEARKLNEKYLTIFCYCHPCLRHCLKSPNISDFLRKTYNQWLFDGIDRGRRGPAAVLEPQLPPTPPPGAPDDANAHSSNSDPAQPAQGFGRTPLWADDTYEPVLPPSHKHTPEDSVPPYLPTCFCHGCNMYREPRNMLPPFREPFKPVRPKCHAWMNPPRTRYDEEVAQALDVARETESDKLDPTIQGILDEALQRIWDNINANPDTYVMTVDQYAVFNFFQARYKNDKVALKAKARHWQMWLGL
ncbi:hypothetical protein QBC46DRAFT_401595 [Diplogelasinospora grovesii]|uniref:Uncharacterized protein n=1 Tax=Diplogelasinospora grovesii TaxID=303347 RepID=A0AAN6MUE3_9PEZI|nr:hypothetical protein QBC46DRAFT_401595 [Diplogelasinospora grovesii]